jgi:tyrosinase
LLLVLPGRQKRYDDFLEVYKNAMVGGPAMIMPMPHGGPLFYPWYRVLLRQFGLALQKAAPGSAQTGLDAR